MLVPAPLAYLILHHNSGMWVKSHNGIWSIAESMLLVTASIQRCRLTIHCQATDANINGGHYGTALQTVSAHVHYHTPCASTYPLCLAQHGQVVIIHVCRSTHKTPSHTCLTLSTAIAPWFSTHHPHTTLDASIGHLINWYNLQSTA